MLALSGCNSAPAPSGADGPSVTVRYVETATPPVVEVTAVNSPALSRAGLVARDGQVLANAPVDRETAPGGGFGLAPTVGVGVFGGSSSGIGTGIGLGFPLGGAAPPPAPVRARARLPVADIESYRRDWADLVVRLLFGTPPGATSSADIPAPAPR